MDEYTSMKEKNTHYWGEIKKHVFAMVVGAGTLSVVLTPLQGLGFMFSTAYFVVMWAAGWGIVAIYKALKDKDGQ